jgi:glycosyltransferase involved in cell wall biosynthesis
MTPAEPTALVVAYNFPPHAAIGTMRTLRVVKQLHRAGWRVRVLTSDPSTYSPSTPVDAALMDEIPPGIEVLRAGSVRWWDRATSMLADTVRGPRQQEGGNQPAPPPVPESRPRRRGTLHAAKDLVDAALSIPDRETGWIVPAVSLALRRGLWSNPPDVIYSSAPPWTAQIVAQALSTILRRPWVADFRDPWSRAPWRGDRYAFALRLAAVLERSVVKRADRVVFVTRGNREEFARYYGPPTSGKFMLATNGCDPVEFDKLERPQAADSDPFVLLHAGSLYGGRSPETLLRALAAAISNGRIDATRFKLRFLGQNAFQEATSLCAQLGLNGVVEFAGRVSRAESLKAMVSSSALLLLQPGHAVSVPGKLYEYFAAGRPVLAVAGEGETATLVRESGVGIVAAPDDAGGLIDGLVAVVEMGRRLVTAPPRETYDGTIGAGRIEQLLREVVASGRMTAKTSA